MFRNLISSKASVRTALARSSSSSSLANGSNNSIAIGGPRTVHSSPHYDAIIVGGGHNGLVCASYLAKHNLKVLVLERRHIVGGAAVTEELFPGFKFSRASYLYSLFRPQIARDLKLFENGVELLPRDPFSFTPTLEGNYLMLGRDMKMNQEEIAKFSKQDGERYPQYEDYISKLTGFFEQLIDLPPFDPQAGSLISQWQTIKTMLTQGFKLRKELPHLYELLVAPASQIIDRWFESEPLRSTIATDAVIGAMVSPSTAGSAYVLMHHVMGEVNGMKGVWAYVKGGMGAISQALEKSAKSLGVAVECNKTVCRVNVQNGKAVGVTLSDGTEIRSSTVFSNATTRVTFLKLLEEPEKLLPSSFLERLKKFDFSSGVTKINVALDRLPNFKAIPGNSIGPQHKGTIHFTQSVSEIEQAFQDAAAGMPSKRPVIEMTIPSTLDNTLAPPGKHVAGLFVQYTPYKLKQGSWDLNTKNQFADRVFSVIEEYAPGFTSSVVGRDVLSPLDLENIFGLTEGNIFHGAMSLGQLFWLRPAPAASRYRSPIANLYMCGSGTHPGGGVMGAPGRNAAMVALQDLKRMKKRA